MIDYSIDWFGFDTQDEEDELELFEMDFLMYEVVVPPFPIKLPACGLYIDEVRGG